MVGEITTPSGRKIPPHRVTREGKPAVDGRAVHDQVFKDRVAKVLEKARALELMHKAKLTPEEHQFEQAQKLAGGGSVEERLVRLRS
jgi:hypothetical protein